MEKPADKPANSGAAARPKYSTVKTNITVSKEAFTLWDKTARELGVTRLEALEKALREMAARNDITVTPKEIRALLGND